MKIRCGGDLGDSVASLKVLRDLGGRHQIFFVDRGPTKIVDRAHLVQSLFEQQPYIEGVECSEEECDIDLTGFRRWHSSSTSLWQAQCMEYTHQTGRLIKQSAEPWITVTPDKSFAGKVIVARSERYTNRRFDPVWAEAVRLYEGRIVFVGLPHEHVIFCTQFGFVPHLQVKDFLQMAQALAGCSLFIGNQSSPQLLAMSVGCPIVQETCDYQPDVILNRKGIQYACDGEAVLPDIGGSGQCHVPAFVDIPENLNTSSVPPGFWQWTDLPPSPHFEIQCDLVMRKEGISPEQARKRLAEFNVKRVPDFFFGAGTGNAPMDLFHLAMRNAHEEPMRNSFQNQIPVLKPSN